MNKRKMEKLKAAGWKVGNAEDFLETMNKTENVSMSKEELEEKMFFWEALELVMQELSDRLPESAKVGFMPRQEVVDAIKVINDTLEEQE